MKNLILVVEDDRVVRNLITTTLKTNGYEFESAKDGKNAIALAASLQPDLIILDLGLPDIDGVRVIAQVREWLSSPILVVSARSEIADKIEALDAGADDYISKPFSVEELLARIRVAMRRVNAGRAADQDEAVFKNGDLKVDFASNCVYVRGEEVYLTAMEYKLLCLLAKNVGKVLTHNYILKEIWGAATGNETRSLRVFMTTLRRKIERDPSKPEYIQTHIGIGYRLNRVSNREEEEDDN